MYKKQDSFVLDMKNFRKCVWKTYICMKYFEV